MTNAPHPTPSAAPNTVPMVSVSELGVEIGGRQIITDVSFDIPRGGSLALVGESGSGKTVTSRVLTGLLKRIGGSVTSGEALVNGVDVAHLDESGWTSLRGRTIALVPQASLSGLDPVMRIGKQLIETIRTLDPGCEDAVARAIELLDHVRLPNPADLLRRYPHELSGGMRQRVMIALALTAQPKLMVADEPTTALDVTVQRDILQLLNELRAEGEMSLLLIAHDLAAVQEVCDNVAVMNKGVLVESGPTASVLSTPTHEYTRALLAARPENATPGHPLAVLGSDGVLRTPDFLPEAARPTGGTAGAPVVQISDDSPQTQPTSPQPLIALSGITMQYRGTKSPSLHPVDLEIAEGESLGIVGESGSGKTTLGRILVGALAPTSGTITVGGQDWSSVRRKDPRRKEVQMVFQDPYGSLTPWRTPRQIVVDVLQRWNSMSRAEARERAGQILSEVGLPSIAMDRRTSNLSGGQCQRAGIARALAAEPRILVADEPTSSLDVSIQAQILNLLLELRYRKDLTLILISHDLGVIRHMTDRAIVLTGGHVVETGETKTVLEQPTNEYTQRLVASTPTLKAKN